MKSRNLIFLIFLAGGLFIGGLAFLVQGWAFGFENVPILAVAPPFFVGAIGGSIIAWLVIKNRDGLFGKIRTEQEISTRLKNEIAHRIRTEEDVQKFSEQYRLITDLSPDAVFVHAENKIVFVNPAMIRLMGASSADQLIGMEALQITHPDLREHVRNLRASMSETGKAVKLHDSLFLDLAGNEIHVESAGTPTKWDGRDAFLVVARDITERKAAETAVRESEQLFRDFAGAVSDRYFECDREGRFVRRFVSGDADNILSEEKFIGKTYWDIHGDTDVNPSITKLKKHMLAGEAFRDCDVEIFPVDGQRRFRRISGVPFYDDDENLAGFHGVAQDVTDRRMAGIRLRESEERFSAIFDNSPSAILLKDLEGRIQLVNKTYEKWRGQSQEEVVGTTIYDRFPPEIADVWMVLERDAVESGAAVESEISLCLPFPDGPERTLAVTKFPVYSADDQMIGIGIIQTDITEQRRAEEQLAHAQKLEAIGQLTGGIAHDFNNMMMVVKINARLLSQDCNEKQKEQIELIQYASTRCAELTRRLLAFSRQQPLRAEVVDLCALSSDMRDLLMRTLGETIEVEISAADDLWPAFADKGQVENAILNLAINARDAMPGGGKMLIECSNALLDDSYVAANPEAAVGKYAVVAVSDCGTGMSDPVISHAFEPFFTTKEVGQGTGLGLSMIYGFAKQSGGHVSIDSEEGVGTTVRLYLPRAQRTLSNSYTEENNAVRARPGEHVLVIEDEGTVRALAVTMLNSLGYRVTDVANATEARKVFIDGRAPDLVLSDIVLPGGTSGPQLAEELGSRYPGVKFIFMSGYPADKPDDHPGPDRELLKKPFEIPQLARALRSALD